MRGRYAAVGITAMAVSAAAFGLYALRSSALPTPAPSQVQQSFPRVVIKEKAHDLGILDSSDKCRHTFVVQNEGDAPLKIVKAGTSCQCTVSMVPVKDIPPGMGGPVEIESKTEDIQGPFSHTASFQTNDPNNPRFELTIQGKVRRYLAADPPSIYQTGLKPGEPVEMSAVIFSEVWDSFMLENVKSSIEGLSWEFQPAAPEELQRHNARSGYRAVFRAPGDWEGAEFAGWVEAEARAAAANKGDSPIFADTKIGTVPDENTKFGTVPDKMSAKMSEKDGREKTRKVSISLGGRKTPIRAVYGPQIDRHGVVHLGTLRQGVGGKAGLLLKISDEHREIRVKEIIKSPNFLDVQVFAETPEMAAKGLYKIVVEVPPDAPPSSHVSPETMGTLQILTDHPIMPEIVKLKISFTVLDEEGM